MTNPYQPVVFLNSRVLKCEGVQNKALEILADEERFKGYKFEFQEDDSSFFACGSYSPLVLTNVETGETVGPQFFFEVDACLKKHQEEIAKACRCKSEAVND